MNKFASFGNSLIDIDNQLQITDKTLQLLENLIDAKNNIC